MPDSVFIDIERLRADLMDRFGSAAFSGFPLALADVANVEDASPEGLVKIAQKEGFDINRYIVDN